MIIFLLCEGLPRTVVNVVNQPRHEVKRGIITLVHASVAEYSEFFLPADDKYVYV